MIDTRKGPPCGNAGCVRGNNHSTFLNSVQRRVGTKHGGAPVEQTVAFWGGMVHAANESEMRLVAPAAFDFRPSSTSPLVGAGVVHPPAPPAHGGLPDAGAYQHDDTDPWVPGCTFHEECRPGGM